MTSKYGQKYSCNLPQIQTRDSKDEVFEEFVTHLSSFFSRPEKCVYRMKGYWTYRLCYGSIIQQYHVNNLKKMRTLPKDHIIIGTFEKDLDWGSLLADEKYKYYEELPRVHRQYFVGGDMCDDTRQPRKAVISYVCDPEAYEDYISNIEEIEVCSYKIIVNTLTMCKHPFFMPGHSAVRHNIQCSPLIAAPQRIRKTPKRQYPIHHSPLEPSWVGNYPTTQHYTLRNYLDDMSNEKKQAPLRKIRRLFHKIASSMKADMHAKVADTNADVKNSELKDIDMDNLTDDDIDQIFKSKVMIFSSSGRGG